MALRLARIFKGSTTIEVGEGRDGLSPKQVLAQELPDDDPVLGLLDDDCCLGTDYRYGKLGGTAERPAGQAEVRTMEGSQGRVTIEMICTHYGKMYADYWVRLLDGSWPTPEELVALCDAYEEPDGTLSDMLNFGGIVNRVSDTVALVQVTVD